MDKKCICILNRYVYKHPILVLEGQNPLPIEEKYVSFDNIVTEIFDNVIKYDLKRLILIGCADYTKKIKEKIELEELTRYNKNILNITIEN